MPRRATVLLSLFAASLGAAVGLPPVTAPAVGRAGEPDAPRTAPAEAVAPTGHHAASLASFISTWCFDCHSGDKPKGDLDLQPVLEGLAADATATPDGIHDPTASSLRRIPALARLIRPRLVARDMPPRDPLPTDSEYVAAIAALDGLAALAVRDLGAPSSSAGPAPGRVTARRLTRYEYANTVRDLLGVDFDPANLPADEVGHGFDNNGDVLSVPPLLLEKYLDAAEAIAAEAIVDLDTGDPKSLRLHGIQLRGKGGARDAGNAWALYSNGEVEGRVQAARRGRYRLAATVLGQQAGPEAVKMTLLWDGKSGERIAVDGNMVEREIEQVVELGEGPHRLGAAFVNDYWKPDHPDPGQRDRNAYVKEITLTGPLDRAVPSPLQREMASWTVDVPEQDRLRATARELAGRAWRHPVDEEALDALVAVAGAACDGQSSSTRHLRTLLTAILVHPRFLFRLEGDPPGSASERPLDAWEIAARLSYFLWSTAPDAALRDAARSRMLDSPEGRAAQVRRLLADPRSLALGEHFATQWLRIRSLEERVPDPERFAAVDAALIEAMRQETVLFFDDVLRREPPIAELLRSNQTFLNEALARHYGIGGVRGSHLRRVSLDGLAAAGGGREAVNDLGLLRHASVLLATSNPSRTSPVKRGKWVLEALLDEPPPPAPPGVPPLPEDRREMKGASLRELMERHRADPDCAGCHRRMDAMGFALEEFDAVGRYRREDDGRLIDATAELPDGSMVAGAAGLRDELLRGDDFTLAFVRHLLTYALGRGLVDDDESTVRAIVESVGSQPTIPAIIGAIVESRAFRYRGAAAE